MAAQSDIRFIWRLIGDDPDDPHWSSAEVGDILDDRASGCVYGAAASLCLAWANELSEEPSALRLGAVNIDKGDPAAAKIRLAERYAAMSTTVSLEAKRVPAFGRARIDWRGQTADGPYTDRIYQENLGNE
jgi:hypothetical protein